MLLIKLNVVCHLKFVPIILICNITFVNILSYKMEYSTETSASLCELQMNMVPHLSVSDQVDGF